MVRIGSRWVAALALVAQAAVGCSSQAVSRRRQRAPDPAPPATTPMTLAAPAAPAPPPHIDKPVLAARLEKAYRLRQSGQVDEASAEFNKVVRILMSAGEVPVPGLGAVTGFAVQGRTTAGFTIDGGAEAGTLFFDMRTGDPFAFSPGVRLRTEGPVVDAPFFVTVAPNKSMGVFDPTTGIDASVGGALFAVHPDGQRAYVLDEHCRVQEWSIAKARTTRALGGHRAALVAADVPSGCHGCGCDAESFRGAVITADGRWISSRWGRWSLATGAFTPLPFFWKWTGFWPAMSPDGRYFAYIRANPRAEPAALVNANYLVLYDVEHGTHRVAPKLLPALSNGHPLSFGTNPRRVCVFDYGRYAFSVPSLALLATWGTDQNVDGAAPSARAPSPLLDCEVMNAPTPLLRADLTARLASRVCFVGGFLLPREQCERWN